MQAVAWSRTTRPPRPAHPPRSGRLGRLLIAFALAALLPIVAGLSRPVVADAGWYAAWSAPPAMRWEASPDTTYRNVVHLSAGGDAVRILLSNRFGTRPLVLGAVTVGRSTTEAGSPGVAPGTLRTVTFDGVRQVRIPPGGQLRSDPIDLWVPDQATLLVTTYVRSAPGGATVHPGTRQVNYEASGNQAREESGAEFRRARPSYWHYVTAVDVRSTSVEGTVVTFGDSLTDGAGSRRNANARYPDELGRRLLSGLDADRLSVANAGISGNRLLTGAEPGFPWRGDAGVERFERDVLSRSGVRTAIVMEGVNDISGNFRPPTADTVVNGLRRLVQRAHARDVEVLCGTIMPYRGYVGWTPAQERVRLEVNARLRGGGVCDGVVDFDRAVRDPDRPAWLRSSYVTPTLDQLHLGDEGQAAMAHAVDLGQL